MNERRDQFLSDEDLDIEALSVEELGAYWLRWLHQAQITNEDDRAVISHGVFESDPAEVAPAPED